MDRRSSLNRLFIELLFYCFTEYFWIVCLNDQLFEIMYKCTTIKVALIFQVS